MSSRAAFGPIRLADGVRRRHVASYLWAAFTGIGLFTYLNMLQPYLLDVNLHVPASARGAVSGSLQFWQELLAIIAAGWIGAWSDRAGRRVIFILGFALLGAAYVLYPLAQNLQQLLAYRLIFALGVAMVGLMLATVLVDYPAEPDRGKLAGVAVLLNSLGALLTFAFLSRLPARLQAMGLSDLWAGRTAYWFAGAISLVGALTMIGLRPGRCDPLQPQVALAKLLRQGIAAGRQPRIALAYGASFMARADLVIVALFLALWAHNVALAEGLSPPEAAKRQGMLLAFVQLCALLWAPVFGWLADRIDRVTLVIVSLCLTILGYGWLGSVDNPLLPGVLPAAALVGIGQTSGMLATQVLIGQESPVAIRGSVVGMIGFFGALGILVIARAGGYAFDQWRPGAPFLIMSAANAALLMFALFVRLRAHAEAASNPS